MLPYAAGIPGELRIIYIPQRIYNWTGPLLKKLEPDVQYHVFYFNPINGDEYDLGSVSGNSKGQWQAPEVPLCQDWVLILEKKFLEFFLSPLEGGGPADYKEYDYDED